MVLLTMTPAMVEALTTRAGLAEHGHKDEKAQDPAQEVMSNPDLESPAVGKPIAHDQVLDLYRACKSNKSAPDTIIGAHSLENLLQGAKVYIPPSPPKIEPTDEYKQLMARLRREQEERDYQKMVNPIGANMQTMRTETFAQRFPSAPYASAQGFGSIHAPTSIDDLGDDDVTYNDIHRQSMLVINFLVTIFGSAAGLWILARWWATPARLFLTLGGSIVVGIAEVAVYSAYIWHLGEAKKQDGKVVEQKRIIDTWVVGEVKDEKEPESVSRVKADDTTTVRRRKAV